MTELKKDNDCKHRYKLGNLGCIHPSRIKDILGEPRVVYCKCIVVREDDERFDFSKCKLYKEGNK